MTFKDDNGNIIDIVDQCAVTKQSISFLNFAIKGDVSINFVVDNNSANRKILGYSGPMMSNQVAWTKQAFSRIKNGNLIDRGYIVIQSEDGDKLNCFYVSGNSNWIGKLNGLIRSLDWSNYVTLYDQNNIYTNLVSATSGVIFPFVDWAYNFGKGYAPYMIGGFSDGASVRILNHDSSGSEDNGFADFYPCLYLKSLVNEILQQNGFKLGGNIVNDQLFNTIVVTPNNGKMTREVKNLLLSGTSQNLAVSGAYQKYTSFTVISDPENLWSSNSYTANKFSAIEIYLTQVSATFTGGVGHFYQIYKNGVSIYSGAFIDTATESHRRICLAKQNDVFEIYIKNNGGSIGTITLNMRVEIPEVVLPGDYVSPANFLPPLKGIEVIKFVCNYFGCYATFDEYSKTVSINIIDKFKKEDAQDWSDYYLSHRAEYTVDRATNNYIRLTQRNDVSIEPYNNKNVVQYGEANITTTNNLKDKTDLINLPISPSAFGKSLNTNWLSSCPLVSLTDSGSGVAYSAITLSFVTRARFTVPDGTIFNFGEVIRITNSAGDNLGYYTIDIGTSSTYIECTFPFQRTDTGIIYRQNVSFNDVGFRIMAAYPNIGVSNFSDQSSIVNVIPSGFSTTTVTKTNYPYAYFTKSLTKKPIDQFKSNCAIDNINISNYTDPTIKELYLSTISSVVKHPTIRAQMRLPVSVYKLYKFDQYVFINSNKLTDYFLVDSIVNYVDSDEQVEVNLYMK